MKPMTFNLVLQCKNLKQAREFYEFQKDYSGKLYIMEPMEMKTWRKKK